VLNESHVACPVPRLRERVETLRLSLADRLGRGQATCLQSSTRCVRASRGYAPAASYGVRCERPRCQGLIQSPAAGRRCDGLGCDGACRIGSLPRGARSTRVRHTRRERRRVTGRIGERDLAGNRCNRHRGRHGCRRDGSVTRNGGGCGCGSCGGRGRGDWPRSDRGRRTRRYRRWRRDRWWLGRRRCRSARSEHEREDCDQMQHLFCFGLFGDCP
jgi:hypothetical protein